MHLLNQPRKIPFWNSEFLKWFCIKSCQWGASHKLTWSLFFPAVLFCEFCLSCCVFLFFGISLWCCLLLASSMAESSCCFQICSPKLGMQVSVYPVESWWSKCESYDSEVTTIHATVDGPWPGVKLALLFILPSCSILFFVPCSFVLSFVFPFLEFSVAGWRNVNLALPFLNHENGDFWILMREISWVLKGQKCSG
jgi:hypothetical protein